MSTVAFIRRMLEAGFTHDDALRAAEAFEATATDMLPTRSKGAIRQARYEERQRQKASESVSTDATDETLSPSPPPQTPPPRPHTREIYTPRAKGPTSTEVARGFVAFWAAYPKRVGKDAAAKSFASAMKRVGGEEPLAVILAGLERALPGWDDPQFIPNPATWLNQGRWTDDAPAPRNGTPRNDRQPSRTAKSDHLAAIGRAMADACGGPDRTGGHPPDPGSGGGMRALPAAA